MSDSHWPTFGWTCFHCNAHFRPTQEGEAAAAEHFGGNLDIPPECRDATSPARKLARRARIAEAASRQIARDRNRIEELNASLEGELYNLRRVLGITRHDSLPMAVDSLRGEVIAAKAVEEWLERRFPNVVQKARQSV